MRQAAHSEAPDKPRVEECRQGHEHRDGRKCHGEPDAKTVDLIVDLLCGVDESEQGAQDERACERVAERHPVGQHDDEAGQHG